MPGCPIVGIGASAGGLEAFSELLKHLPTNTGFGFVLVQHLDPQHESALAQLLARTTTMPVCEVTNNLRVKANHVYIIPPNTHLGIAQGVLKLHPRSRSALSPRSIDFFFEALAKDQRQRAVGVILSGSATDGTLGLEAIKVAGGLTLAQDDSARYDSMPRSAQAAGCVDLVRSPKGIAQELARIAHHPYLAPGRETKGSRTKNRMPQPAAFAVAGEPEQASYQAVLALLYQHRGVDFSLYKTTTIHRRIVRRTVLNRQHTLAGYVAFLQGNGPELDALYADVLISVTSFFRDPDAYLVLQERVFSRLLSQRPSDPLRVWVMGCSTGQEAYSIAMAYAESAEKSPRAPQLQMFATDLSEANLEKARHGLYPKSLVQDVSPARLRRFFVEETGGYRVIKSLRESIVFARQNIIGDPPFSRLDLISCRNLLIYLQPSTQKKILPTFHYALKPGGFLFLGASESIGGFGHLFQPVDKKQKLYASKAASTRMFHLPAKKSLGAGPAAQPNAPASRLRDGKRPAAANAFRIELDAEREADRLTLHQFAPPGVLINRDLQILQFRGQTGAYLEPPTGKATFDLLRMARAGLMLPLRDAVASAVKRGKITRLENVPVERGGKTRMVHIDVLPLQNLKELCLLVLFHESEKARTGAGDAGWQFASAKPEEPGRVAGLERDLSDARDYLHSVQAHHEAANEELQASNEELQSLNEELETSKEELVSTNEELTTVNEEMTSRNTELHRVMTSREAAEEALRLAQIQLAGHASRLETLVAKRTAQLTATNRRLEVSVASTRKGAEQYRLLLAESRVMQAKLRHVTRQILTAQENERKELSRELHDEVVQTLIGINVELTALGASDVVDARALKSKIARSQRLVERSVTAVHRFARGLRPSVLDDLGLIPALHAYCKGLAAQKKLSISMTAMRRVEALDEAGKIVLFRVAQEALNNVVRHARASRVLVGLTEVSGSIQMDISDNGQAFDVAKVLGAKNPRRLGLIGMKERIEMIGGTLQVVSTAGTGTNVRVQVPFGPGKAAP